jgi:hypothetical protein
MNERGVAHMKIDGNSTQKKVEAQKSTPYQAKSDSVIANLQKQIEMVQKQLDGVMSNKNLGPKEQLEKQKQLQAELQDLIQQVAQRQIEIQKEQTEKVKEAAESQQTQVVQDQYTKGVEEMNFVNLASSLKEVKIHSTIRTEMKGKSKILESEIKLDASRGVDTTAKQEDLRKINSNLKKIDNKIKETLIETNEELKKARTEDKTTDRIEDNANIKNGEVQQAEIDE